MKKIYTILTFLTATSIFATDRFVDPNLSSGNGTTLFTTITSAVNAAVNGDRIIISSTTYNEPELTITKSLQIMPQTPGTTINFNANIIISGFAGMKLEIIGFNLGIYSFSSNPITSGSYTNRAKISIIECSAANANFDNEFYELNLIKNIFTADVNLKYGSVVLNSMLNCNIWDEQQTTSSINNRIIVINNTISVRLIYYNSVYKFVIANNTLKDILIKRWNPDPIVKNKVINNEFIDGASFGISMFDVPYYNLNVSSNKFNGSVSFLTCTISNSGYYPISGNIGSYSSVALNQAPGPGQFNSYSATGYSNSTISPNPNVGGFFEWSFNGIDYPFGATISSNQPLALTRIIGQTDDIDGGSPNHDFYDIDLTINDRGRNGGPYSLLNYNPTSNPNNSKAFIFDLDMPTDLFPGQNIDIKAKGCHKN